MDLEASMSIFSKRELYQVVRLRYHDQGKLGKKVILDEFSANTGFSRKYAIRLLNEGYKRGKKKPGPKSKYSSDLKFCEALRSCWRLLNYCSGKLLKTELSTLVTFYEKNYEILPLESKNKLLKVSSATIDRILKRYRSYGRTTTKPGSILKTEIPIQGCIWDESVPGFVEADTVAHCGMSTRGIYINTLTLTDLATQWTECRAVFGKSAEVTLEAIKNIQQSVPFVIKGFDSDNGNEFLNNHLIKYLAEQNIKMTRSRPYRKDDNAHVEQKNWSFVRQIMGYGRMENPDLVPVMNQLYYHWCLLKNMFVPCMKLKEKRRVGSKIYRIHDEPKTPYKRLLESSYISDVTKQKITKLYEAQDPYQLKREIDRLSKIVSRLAKISYEDWKQTQSLPN